MLSIIMPDETFIKDEKGNPIFKITPLSDWELDHEDIAKLTDILVVEEGGKETQSPTEIEIAAITLLRHDRYEIYYPPLKAWAREIFKDVNYDLPLQSFWDGLKGTEQGNRIIKDCKKHGFPITPMDERSTPRIYDEIYNDRCIPEGLFGWETKVIRSNQMQHAIFILLSGIVDYRKEGRPVGDVSMMVPIYGWRIRTSLAAKLVEYVETTRNIDKIFTRDLKYEKMEELKKNQGS